jgi:hypothetical protein
MVDELFDVWHGVKFFTKVDLRSGYHQVCMNPADIYKMMFHTHDTIYEFLVMPINLYNTPAMFQAMMNDILHTFLH